MRCKNCGAENDESRFICEICGSPLYDENDEIMSAENLENDDNGDYSDYNNNDDENKKKRNIIIGIVIAAAAVAIIAGIVFGLNKNSKAPETTASSVYSTSEETSTTKKHTTTKSPEEATSNTTTAATSETTTKPTTTATTVPSFRISVDIDGNGSVSGDGTYKSGKKAALIATPDDGYQFAGWYDNSTGKLVASANKYTVSVSSDLKLTAKFELVATTAEEAAEQ